VADGRQHHRQAGETVAEGLAEQMGQGGVVHSRDFRLGRGRAGGGGARPIRSAPEP
jgi:hypothetical protein